MNRDALIEQILRYARATLQPPWEHQFSLIEWIPVGERLPESGIIVVGMFHNIHSTQPSFREIAHYGVEGWLFDDGSEIDPHWDITHYAEIPEIHARD